MCLIVENKTNKKLKNLIGEEKLLSFINQNPDGFGITFFNGHTIDTIKSFGAQKFFESLSFVESKNYHYYIHFRKATVGKISIENTHPFNIDDNHKLYLMHNGTLPGFQDCDKELKLDFSDTAILSHEIKKLLKPHNYNLKLLENNKIKLQIEKILGTGRAVLISPSISVILNQPLWINDETGLLFSKKIN